MSPLLILFLSGATAALGPGPETAHPDSARAARSPGAFAAESTAMVPTATTDRVAAPACTYRLKFVASEAEGLPGDSVAVRVLVGPPSYRAAHPTYVHPFASPSMHPLRC